MAEKNKKTEAKTTKTEAKAEANKAETPAAGTSNNQSIIIAVLATVLVCFILVFGILLATGVIRFSGDNDTPDKNGTNLPGDDRGSGDKRTSGTDTRKLIDNPNKRVTVKDSTLVSVKDLEFYLPDDFQAGGKNDNGAYTYNLVDDDGWAQVLVYAEKSSLTPEKYLMKISPYLDITDTNYRMNGTTWVVGENANALAYATELDGMIYAVYYNVKLDSEETGEAMQMIPKTLYMKKIYAE